MAGAEERVVRVVDGEVGPLLGRIDDPVAYPPSLPAARKGAARDERCYAVPFGEGVRMAFMEETEVLVEAAQHGVRLGRSSEMPLAHQCRGVAPAVAQCGGHRLLIARQADAGVQVVELDRIEIVAEASLELPRHQSGTGWCAERRRHVAGREAP